MAICPRRYCKNKQIKVIKIVAFVENPVQNVKTIEKRTRLRYTFYELLETFPAIHHCNSGKITEIATNKYFRRKEQ